MGKTRCRAMKRVLKFLLDWRAEYGALPNLAVFGARGIAGIVLFLLLFGIIHEANSVWAWVLGVLFWVICYALGYVDGRLDETKEHTTMIN
jgi:hypothetical protein